MTSVLTLRNGIKVKTSNNSWGDTKVIKGNENHKPGSIIILLHHGKENPAGWTGGAWGNAYDVKESHPSLWDRIKNAIRGKR
jgi:hypothetical protein